MKKILSILFGLILAISLSAFYKLQAAAPVLSMHQLTEIIQKSDISSELNIKANPEILASINQILNTESARQDMRSSLDRMKTYEPTIKPLLIKNGVPADFIAIPLMESHYRNENNQKNSATPTGIWQITPSTAKMLGLVVNNQRDDRLDVALSSEAMGRYFKMLYVKFQDWNLVLVAFNLGDGKAAELVKSVGTKDVWTITNSAKAPKQLDAFLSVLMAEIIIIMHNPKLLD